MRDVKFHPGHKFGELLRSAKGAAHSDPGLRGEKKPKTEMEAMPGAEVGGSAGNRKGKPSHPSGTTRHDAHKIKGKVKRVEIEAMHGGHKVRIGYHPKKGKKGEPMMHYMEPEEHVHSSRASLMSHVGDAIDNMEPETSDSSDLAKEI